MAQKVLPRNGDDHLQIYASEYALTGQAGIDAGVHGAVNEVFLFIADVGQFVAALFNIDVAGTATAHASAVMLKLNAVVEGYIQYRLAGGRYMGNGWLAILKLKRDS